jgi:hypothetical protein
VFEEKYLKENYSIISDYNSNMSNVNVNSDLEGELDYSVISEGGIQQNVNLNNNDLINNHSTGNSKVYNCNSDSEHVLNTTIYSDSEQNGEVSLNNEKVIVSSDSYTESLNDNKNNISNSISINRENNTTSNNISIIKMIKKKNNSLNSNSYQKKNSLSEDIEEIIMPLFEENSKTGRKRELPYAIKQPKREKNLQVILSFFHFLYFFFFPILI